MFSVRGIQMGRSSIPCASAASRMSWIAAKAGVPNRARALRSARTAHRLSMSKTMVVPRRCGKVGTSPSRTASSSADMLDSPGRAALLPLVAVYCPSAPSWTRAHFTPAASRAASDAYEEAPAMLALAWSPALVVRALTLKDWRAVAADATADARACPLV